MKPREDKARGQVKDRHAAAQCAPDGDRFIVRDGERSLGVPCKTRGTAWVSAEWHTRPKASA